VERVDERLVAGGGVVDLLGVPVAVADVGFGDGRVGGGVEGLPAGPAGLLGDGLAGRRPIMTDSTVGMVVSMSAALAWRVTASSSVAAIAMTVKPIL
jgi:hypothetical protein